MANVKSVSGIQLSGRIDMEVTLAFIKPDAYARSEEILEVILSHNFIILQRRAVKLSAEDASEFYAEECGTMSFAGRVTFLSSGPLLVLLVTHPGGPGVTVDQFKRLVGPTNSNKAREICPDSLRALFGTDGLRNAVHASGSLTAAKGEIRFFFPSVTVDHLRLQHNAKEYLDEFVTPTLLQGLDALCKCKPRAPVVWLADWLLNNNPKKPRILHPDPSG
uniref:nucleoside diphosphate kinase homolog 5-like n=1 Tax=Myxine glutinosa TaxID=7769 RepID=UPI00358F4A06